MGRLSPIALLCRRALAYPTLTWRTNCLWHQHGMPPHQWCKNHQYIRPFSCLSRTFWMLNLGWRPSVELRGFCLQATALMVTYMTSLLRAEDPCWGMSLKMYWICFLLLMSTAMCQLEVYYLTLSLHQWYSFARLTCLPPPHWTTRDFTKSAWVSCGFTHWMRVHDIYSTTSFYHDHVKIWGFLTFSSFLKLILVQFWCLTTHFKAYDLLLLYKNIFATDRAYKTNQKGKDVLTSAIFSTFLLFLDALKAPGGKITYWRCQIWQKNLQWKVSQSAEKTFSITLLLGGLSVKLNNLTRSPWALCRAVFLFLSISNVVVIFYYIFINVQLLWLLHSIGPSP